MRADDLETLKKVYEQLYFDGEVSSKLIPEFRQVLNRLDVEFNTPAVPVISCQETVKLAVQYTLTGILETKLHAVLNAKIDAEVAKFWEALGYVQNSCNNSMVDINSNHSFDDDRHL